VIRQFGAHTPLVELLMLHACIELFPNPMTAFLSREKERRQASVCLLDSFVCCHFKSKFDFQNVLILFRSNTHFLESL
jgi:hypothetical protein